MCLLDEIKSMKYKRDIDDVVITESEIKFPVKDKTISLSFDDVVGCNVVLPKNEESDRFCCGGRKLKATVTVLQGFIRICYIHRPPGEIFKWKTNEICIHAIPEKCYSLQKDIESYLQNVEERPKSLVVLINPISGKKKAVQIFKKKVAPLLELAKIKTTVFHSTHQKHLEELVMQLDLQSTNGIVIMGGDGSACEVMNAVVKKTQGLNGEPITDMAQITVPIAIIPVGSANAFAEDLYGAQSVTTAILHVIKGKKKLRPLMGVYTGGEFLSCSCAILCSGLYCDMMYLAEKRRAMGVGRYALVAMWLIIIKGHPEYEAKVTFTTRRTDDTSGDDVQETPTKEQTGRYISFVNFNGNIMDLKHDKQYATLSEKLADSNPPVTNLLGYKRAVGFSIMKHMMEMQSRKEQSLRKPFLDVLNATSYTVQLIPDTKDKKNAKYEVNSKPTAHEYDPYSCMSVDGEIFPIIDHTFEARLHPQAVTVFSSV